MTCRVCGAHREARAGDLWCAGPADLCDQHYNEWFRAYSRALAGGAEREAAHREATAHVMEQQAA